MVIVGVVVVGSVGFYLLTSRAPQITQTSTIQSVTSKPVVVFKLFGKIFFDYNGNGIQEKDEPAVPNVAIALDGFNVTVTNSTGWYAITNVANGNHTIRPYPPRNFTYTYGYSTRLANFRYMCESDAEYRSVDDPYQVSVLNDTRKDIGLMEGFLTMPFPKGTVENYRRWYVDISDTSRPMDWRGGDWTYERPGYRHSGTDYMITKMTPVMAAAPGVISGYSVNDPNGGHTVWIEHEQGYYTYYAHLEMIVKSRGLVKRGEIIGYSGASAMSGIVSPHLYFELEKPPASRNMPVTSPIDPYRSLVPGLGSLFSSWTKDNDPQFYA